jgi:hypothetical protein
MYSPILFCCSCRTLSEALYRDLDKRIDFVVRVDLHRTPLMTLRRTRYCTTALSINQTAWFANETPIFLNIEVKCSFTLLHKQLHKSPRKVNCIQIHESEYRTHGISIDTIACRRGAARNRYSRISAKQVYAIEGLPDYTNLTIRGENEADEVTCEHDGNLFSSDAMNKLRDAYCISGMWDRDVETGVGCRVSS